MMTAFQFLPHSADIRLKVTGATRKELFNSALAGMSYIQKKEFCQSEGRIFTLKDQIKVTAEDITSLLIDFLSEILTLCYINRAVYCEAEYQELSGTSLVAAIKGTPVDYFEEEIKAVTYHEADVKQNSEKQLETIIIFDI